MNLNQLKLSRVKRKLEYKSEISEIDETIMKSIRRENKSFVKSNKKIFLAMDIIMILVIIMNLGALMITNALVFKVEPGDPSPTIVEANPVVAKLDGFQAAPGGFKAINQFFRVIIAWSIFIYIYLYRRLHIYQNNQLNLLIWYVLFVFIALGYDFINDFGFLIGKIWYG